MLMIQLKREERGWSRAELARQAGLNQATVGAIENGRLQPYDSQLLKLARALEVPASSAALLMKEVEERGHDASH
jgi:transcriptional regulator with XRE-family HTH domain